MKKKEIEAVAWLLIIGLPIYVIIQLGESAGWIPLILVVLSIITFFIFYKKLKTKKRRQMLIEKYHDESLVEDLMKELFWQGQTSEQLYDSLGAPHDIDQKVLKTKKKEIWKYNHLGGNRYGLRITLDNDSVVGWDKK